MGDAACQEVIVGVGDCRTASFPVSFLSTYALGSCIAVVAYDWKIRVGGLLHVMLPDSAIGRSFECFNPFVYVDTGVPELFRRLTEMGCAKKNVRCCIAGGASMMADSAHFEIGRRNHLAIRKAFWKHGIMVDREDIGGNQSRSVRLDLQTGRTDLRKGSGQQQILMPAGVNLIGRDIKDANPGR